MNVGRRIAVAATVAGLVVGGLTACGSESRPTNGPGGPAYDPAGSPTSTASPTDPGEPGSSPSLTMPAGGTRTVVGTVTQGAEPSCLILQSKEGQFELISPDPVPREGDHVTVTGHVVKAMSHCMQGQMFLVQKLTIG